MLKRHSRGTPSYSEYSEQHPGQGALPDRQKPGMPVLSHRFEFLVESGRARVLVISVELTTANKERIFQRAQGEATQAVSSKRAHVLVLIGLI